LDLLLTNKEDLSDTANAKGSLGCSGHETVAFKILSMTNSRIATLESERADFILLEDLLGSISWETTLQGKEAQEGWLAFKDSFPGAEGGCTATGRAEQAQQQPCWDERGAPSRAQAQTGQGGERHK